MLLRRRTRTQGWFMSCHVQKRKRKKEQEKKEMSPARIEPATSALRSRSLKPLGHRGFMIESAGLPGHYPPSGGRVWARVRHEPSLGTCATSQKYFLLFSSPTLCIDSISDISLPISLIPTEKKTSPLKQT